MSPTLDIKTRIKRILSLGHDKSEQETITTIEDGIEFKGAKLWVLVLAIFVASLGLNTNSTAVIIGAMLISPLMGPIIGMGLGVGINNYALFKRAFHSYLIATVFSIVTATLFFLISPIEQAQSELLARTSPTIYDVFIALCGGLAGIIALSSYSQRSGNVIPGVAIATALMPPLCTAGFGLATQNWLYALGAFYLYLINTIFIALATYFGVKFIMRFHKTEFVDKAKEKRVTHIITAIAIVTFIPSIFITINIANRSVFEQRCQRFVSQEMKLKGTRVIAHDCDYTSRSLRVVVLGEVIDSTQQQDINRKLTDYHLDNVRLDIVQNTTGLDEASVRSLLSNERQMAIDYEETITELRRQLSASDIELRTYQDVAAFAPTLLPELRTLFPEVTSISMSQGTEAYMDSVPHNVPVTIVQLKFNRPLDAEKLQRLAQWLKQRTQREDLRIEY